MKYDFEQFDYHVYFDPLASGWSGHIYLNVSLIICVHARMSMTYFKESATLKEKNVE